MKEKNLLTLAEMSPPDLASVLDLAAKLKAHRQERLGSNALNGRSVALLFSALAILKRESLTI